MCNYAAVLISRIMVLPFVRPLRTRYINLKTKKRKELN